MEKELVEDWTIEHRNLITGYVNIERYQNRTIQQNATSKYYIPVESLITNKTVTLKLIQAYNEFKPKGSQVGVLLPQLQPSWFQNPTLRGSISAAITDQP